MFTLSIFISNGTVPWPPSPSRPSLRSVRLEKEEDGEKGVEDREKGGEGGGGGVEAVMAKVRDVLLGNMGGGRGGVKQEVQLVVPACLLGLHEDW